MFYESWIIIIKRIGIFNVLATISCYVWLYMGHASALAYFWLIFCLGLPSFLFAILQRLEECSVQSVQGEIKALSPKVSGEIISESKESIQNKQAHTDDSVKNTSQTFQEMANNPISSEDLKEEQKNSYFYFISNPWADLASICAFWLYSITTIITTKIFFNVQTFICLLLISAGTAIWLYIIRKSKLYHNNEAYLLFISISQIIFSIGCSIYVGLKICPSLYHTIFGPILTEKNIYSPILSLSFYIIIYGLIAGTYYLFNIGFMCFSCFFKSDLQDYCEIKNKCIRCIYSIIFMLIPTLGMVFFSNVVIYLVCVWISLFALYLSFKLLYSLPQVSEFAAAVLMPFAFNCLLMCILVTLNNIRTHQKEQKNANDRYIRVSTTNDDTFEYMTRNAETNRRMLLEEEKRAKMPPRGERYN